MTEPTSTVTREDLPLAGFTVAVTADRRRDELSALLERRGARVVLAPALRIVPVADDTELRAATVSCVDDPERLARFVSFVNAPDTPDPTISFVSERGQPVPLVLGVRP